MTGNAPRRSAKGFGAAGSHAIKPPASPPVPAMALQFLGTFLTAWVIGVAVAAEALLVAAVLIGAIAALQAAGSLFSQKITAAAAIDGGYVLAMGALMVAVHLPA